MIPTNKPPKPNWQPDIHKGTSDCQFSILNDQIAALIASQFYIDN